ncbi:MAG: flagellar motor protein [Clostridia bacterium]|nr:flagellar motor protein [Clostridia bacterium]
MDIFAFVGIIVGTTMILGAQAMEGGNVGQLLQITAGMIVFGGTAGGVIVSFPPDDLKTGLKMLKTVVFPPQVDYPKLIQEIVGFATKARKEGVIILEKEAKNASDPLLAMGLEAVADGADPTLVQGMMENQIGQIEEMVKKGAAIWESAGGYLPTFGIIGAVIGLIQVMQNLSDPSKLGAGIAVAFVATVYGLYAANLIFIPCGTRIKANYQKLILAKEIMLEGILSIQAGESPALIERKLNSYLLKDE